MTTNQKEMFGNLELDKKIVSALTAMGFEEPSPIQEQTNTFGIGRQRRYRSGSNGHR